ncbi:retrotransposon protein, putative, ty1-copia subclass [Tanacetum coccineum]
MFVIEQLLLLIPMHKCWQNGMHYMMHTMRWLELKSMFEKQAGVERFDLIQTLHACKQEEGKPVAAYGLHMKGYVSQLERLGHMLPQDLIVGLILNDLTKDFAGFVRNYNMHNMGKTIGELHAMLIEYEKGLPKKAETPQVMMIKGGKIQKAKKKSLKAKGKGKANGKGNDKQVYIPKPKNPKPSAKEHPAKDDTCHHCKEVGHWKRNCHVYLAELLKKKKQVGSASSSGIFTIELFAFPNKSWVYDTGCGTHICITKQGFREARKLKQGALYLYVGNGVRAQVEAIGSYDLVLPNGLVICLDNCHYAPSITRGVVSVHRLDYALESATRILNVVLTKKALVKRDMLDKLQQRSVKYIFIGYPKETMGYYFYFPPENKIVVARYFEFFEKNLITQEVSRRAIDLEEIQDEDTSPSEITSEIPMKVEGFEPPQEEVILIRRSERSRRVPNHLCLNVEVEEHSLGDLNEPTSYKAAMLDSESNKWFDAMNAEIQSMIDNMVWVLVDLPPSCKTVGSKYIFKKNTDMDGIVHTFNARLVAKGYTQLYEVDYEETFSPVADIRAIRILISIAAKVCKLPRFIYGFKQASRSWNKRFDEEIKRLDLLNNFDEPCVIKWLVGVMFHPHLVLGEATFILGIKIYRDRSKRLIGLSQNAYMDKILKRYKMDNSKRGTIPMQERLDLNKSQGAQTPKKVNRIKDVPYASAVGSIMYAVRCTRPDVAFA